MKLKTVLRCFEQYVALITTFTIFAHNSGDMCTEQYKTLRCEYM